MQTDQPIPTLEQFLRLPAEQVAELVRRDKSRVCVFPINGTRRWFVLEHPDQAAGGLTREYMHLAGQRHVELYALFFDHGIDTLLTPIFGPDLLDRGQEYRQMLETGLLWFATHPDFIEFYDAYDVRVHVYGDAARYLRGTPFAHALEVYEELARRTASHRRHRLFFGVCAHDPTETIADTAIQFFQQHGRVPDRRHIVESYYGEYVEPVDLFIGFDRPAAFDMPLVATGNEDLYFTVNPSPYMNSHTLRLVLYDHLYARRVDDADYAFLSSGVWRTLAQFYALNRHSVLGLGRRHGSGAFWYPLPQVKLPESLLGGSRPDRRTVINKEA